MLAYMIVDELYVRLYLTSIKHHPQTPSPVELLHVTYWAGFLALSLVCQ